MHFRKKLASNVIILFLLLICAFSFTTIYANAQEDYLYLGGFPAGFTLNTKIVEVVGICDVMTADGAASPARNAGIRNGDIIESINGRKVECATDINKIIADEYKKYVVEIERGGEKIALDILPAKDFTTGSKRLGILVKDTISGIGTVTYIDKANNKFASLGHPVNDLKNNLIEINGGIVYNCLIYDIKRGVKGEQIGRAHV